MQGLIGKIRPTLGLVVGATILVLLAIVTGGLTAGAFVESVLLVGVMVASVLAHELSHAVAARRAGMTVDAISVSLLGGVTYYSGRDPDAAVLRRIALAGPKTSFLLVAGCLGVLLVEATVGWRTGFGWVAAWGLQINLGLGAVNLLPFGSLDGAVIRAARRRRG